MPSTVSPKLTHKSKQSFSLFQLKEDNPWTISGDSAVLLSGGHGQELVRTFCFLDKVSRALTFLSNPS